LPIATTLSPSTYMVCQLPNTPTGQCHQVYQVMSTMSRGHSRLFQIHAASSRMAKLREKLEIEGSICMYGRTKLKKLRKKKTFYLA